MEENLFDHLWKEFVRTFAERAGLQGPAPDLANLDAGRAMMEFRDFCKKHMESNPPVGTTVLDRGLGLRLRHGQVVSFVEPEKPKPGSEVRAIFVNPGMSGDPSRHGISDTAAVQVTGNQKR
jgi:hypothetical protein